ncbi:MAG: adenosylcobinamide-GDP ribazoletransferase [Chloroflexota bacterium]|nr:adenosylcobinamide-GDP ribazoletransferase [Chloroflexota bacterium]MDE2958428.1 adenosylcobinamide-GDP ribazoletransferase [Chloroflexota bacterium]
MRYLFAPLLVALSFLTLLPVGVANPTDAEISRSRGWYPFVGLLYGLVLVILVIVLGSLPDAFPRPLLTAALILTALALLNRFLHLDGLMDFCDAMWGGRTVERRLEIMRDSRVGSFAVAGCFCVLLIKFAALSSLVMTQAVAVVLLSFPIISRWSMTLLLTAFPYGRQQGIGSAFFAGGRPWLATALALLSTAAVCWLCLGVVGVSVLAASSLLALALGFWAARRLGGGLTGDCYGATNEIVEAFSLACFVAWLGFDPPDYLDAGYGAAIVFKYLSWLFPPLGGWFSYSP